MPAAARNPAGAAPVVAAAPDTQAAAQAAPVVAAAPDSQAAAPRAAPAEAAVDTRVAPAAVAPAEAVVDTRVVPRLAAPAEAVIDTRVVPAEAAPDTQAVPRLAGRRGRRPLRVARMPGPAVPGQWRRTPGRTSRPLLPLFRNSCKTLAYPPKRFSMHCLACRCWPPKIHDINITNGPVCISP